ncbi:hypothetical protein DL96DRAFT_1734170 [Flagelloscypha sp. PMI_526]|nr:hypothetical protein DL96DRAFT_1734170 [Flagelloscypha sp. PMI_526]
MKFSTTVSVLLAATAISALPVPLNDDAARVELSLWRKREALNDDAAGVELSLWRKREALNDDAAGVELSLWRKHEALNDDAAGVELSLWRKRKAAMRAELLDPGLARDSSQKLSMWQNL